MLKVIYHPRVSDDLLNIPKSYLPKIERAIANKLCKYPELFGRRLSGILQECWKLRVNNYRIIYLTDKKTVYIVAIGNRKDIYKVSERRVK